MDNERIKTLQKKLSSPALRAGDTSSRKSIVENTPTAQKKACVLTYGCPESRIDSARVQVFLERNGYVMTNLEEADLILFRTCGASEGRDILSLKAIEKIKSKMKEDAILIPWGCLPKINPSALKDENTLGGEEDLWKLNDVVGARKPIEEVHANFLLPTYKINALERIVRFLGNFPVNLCDGLRYAVYGHPETKHDEYGTPYCIKVSTGCLSRCSYCVIRLSRGILRSKSIDEVASEFKRGMRLGYRDFRLLGTDLGAYGKDNGYTLIELLDELTKAEGKYVISLKNINPYWLIKMYEDLKPILFSGKIRYLSSAIESGSNRILTLMGRWYRVEEYLPIFQDLNRNHPRISLCTQIIVGFPTETEQDFQQSEEVLKKILYDMVEIYPFSPRTGTPAANMNGQIPENVKKIRYLRLWTVSMLSIFRRKSLNSARASKVLQKQRG